MSPLTFAVLASLPIVQDVGEIVVTAAPFPISLETATTHVEILKSDELAVLPPGGLGDMLAAVPGLRSSGYAPGASRPVIRGQSGQRVQVLQNGVGMIDASALSPDHAVASDPMEASRIEVLRGPSALAYGGSGVGGVVNVIDERIPRKAPANGRSGRFTASAGGPGDGRNFAGTWTVGEGPWVGTFDATRRDSGDYGTPDPADAPVNSAVTFASLGAGLAYVGEQGSIGASYKYTGTDYGVPSPKILPPGAEGPVGIVLRQDRIDLRGQRQVAIGPFELARLSAGWANYRHAEIDRASGDVGTAFESDGAEGRLELVQRERSGWQGAVGVQGLSRDLAAIGDEAFIPPSKVAEGAIFTLQRYETERWGVDAGLRFDRRTITTDIDRQGVTNVSTSAGLFWRPSERAFYALSISRNARAPTEFELYADGPHPGTGAYELGDAAIGPEVANSVEALGRWRIGRLSLEGHLFAAAYDGFIDQRPTGAVEDGLPVFAFVQTQARFHGGEAEASYALLENPRGALALEGSLDFVRGETDLGPPARIPPYAATVRLTWAGAHVDAAAEVRRVGEQDHVAAFETPTAAYALVNLNAAWRPRGDQSLRMFVDGRNLTNQEAREHVSFLKDIAPMPGRTVRIGVASSF